MHNVYKYPSMYVKYNMITLSLFYLYKIKYTSSYYTVSNVLLALRDVATL